MVKLYVGSYPGKMTVPKAEKSTPFAPAGWAKKAKKPPKINDRSGDARVAFPFKALIDDLDENQEDPLAGCEPQILDFKADNKNTAWTTHFKDDGRSGAAQACIEIITGLSKTDLLDERVGLQPRYKKCQDFYFYGPHRDGTNPLSETMKKIIRQFMVANNYVNNGKHLPNRSYLYDSLLVRLDVHKCMIYKSLQQETQELIDYFAFYATVFIAEESKDWKAKGMMKWSPSFSLFIFLPHMQQWTDFDWNGDMTLPTPMQPSNATLKDSISTSQDFKITTNSGNNGEIVLASGIDAFRKTTSFPQTPPPLTERKRSKDPVVEDIQASEDKFHQTALFPMTPPSSTKRKHSIFASPESPTAKRSRATMSETLDLVSSPRPCVEIVDLSNWDLPSATQQEASDLADILAKARYVLEGMRTKIVHQIKKGELQGGVWLKKKIKEVEATVISGEECLDSLRQALPDEEIDM